MLAVPLLPPTYGSTPLTEFTEEELHGDHASNAQEEGELDPEPSQTWGGTSPNSQQVRTLISYSNP